jgi:hypothetical protein
VPGIKELEASATSVGSLRLLEAHAASRRLRSVYGTRDLGRRFRQT